MNARRLLVFTLTLLVAGLLPALAQTSQTGIVSGRVLDSDGDGVKDAIVTVAQPDGAYRKTGVTDRDGNYRVAFLPPGIYNVSVQAAGFNPRRVADVRVSAAQITTLRIDLLGQLVEELEVRAAAPLIDMSTTELSTTTFQAETINALPSDRQATDLIKFTPGARENQIWGATNSQANAYQLDGVSVNSPGFGGDFLLPNVDWIEEFQVRGLGAGAEYGNFQGGLINIVTKSGSNTFEANARINYESESLNSSNVIVGEEGEEIDQRIEVNADISGPIIEDKLFYFLSIQEISRDLRVLDATADEVAFIDTLEERTERKLYGKLTWQVSDNDTLNFVLGVDDVEGDFRGVGPFTEPAASEKQDSPSTFYNFSWTRSFGNDLFLETKITGYGGEDNRLPYNGDRAAVQQLGGDRALFSNAVYTRYREPESTGLTVNLDAYKNWGSVLHHIKVGGEYISGSWDERRLRNGNLTWRPRIINDPDLGDPPFDPRDVDTWVGFISSDWGGDILLDAETTNGALYVQDYMTLTDRLNVSAGLRWNFWEGEVTPGFSGGGKFTAVDDDAIDPRIGLSYDFTGKGEWVGKIHWGRYHQNLIAVMFDRVEGASIFRDIEYWDWVGDGLPDIDRAYTEAERDANPDDWEFFDAAPLGQEVGPVVDWDQPYVDQWVVGLERGIGERWKVGVTYVNRVNKDLVSLVDRNLATNYTRFDNVEVYDWTVGEDVLLEGEPLVLPSLYISNLRIKELGFAPGLTPEEIDALTWDQDLVLTNVPDADRELDQLQLTVDYRASKWNVSGSLVWSELEGNWNSVSGYANASGDEGSGGFVRPNEQINWFGDLPASSDLEAKVWFRAQLPLGFRVGGYLRYFSGDTYTPVYEIDTAVHDFYTADGDYIDYELVQSNSAGQGGVDGQQIFVERRGSREYESETTLDLKVEKLVAISDAELVFSVDMFNVFNADSVVAVENLINIDFDRVTLRQRPREMRLSASLRW